MSIDAINVIDGSRNQHEINTDIYSLTKTNAERFIDFSTAVDAASYIMELVSTMPEGATLLIPSGKWAIKSNCTILKQINIKCDGELVVDGSNPAAIFRMKRDPVYTLNGTDLTRLPKKGDIKLSFNNITLFDPATHYVVLNSTEVETVRIGYADPYYKNETLDFIDSNFNLRGQIDLDYTDASKLTIRVYKKHNPANVQLRASYQPSIGQTTGLKIIEVIGCDHITWDVSLDRTTSKNIAGSSFAYTNCMHFTFMPSCRISGGQSDYGDSYAFQNTCSSYILNYGIKYFDCGATNKKERGYAGRHGKYVYFEACSLNGIDDHYGHHYYIRNMNFHNRGIGISGGYITIENCNQYSSSEPLYFLRTDTPYADGHLRIINCSAKVLLALTSVNNSVYSAKFKMFDSIVLRDIKAYIGTSHFINIGSFLSHNVNSQTEIFEISNVQVMRTGGGRFLSDSDETTRFKRIEVNNFRIISDTSNSQIITRLVADIINITNCSEIDGSLLARDINIYATKYGYSATSTNMLCATGRLILNNSEIIDAGGIYSTKETIGDIYLYNSRINSWRFFAVPKFIAKVVVSIGTTSNTSNPLPFDLFNYNKLAIDRVATANKIIGTLDAGMVTDISQVSISGARLGDVVSTSITSTAANGLCINAWVSADNIVKYYIENPARNPNGSQTVESVNIRFIVKNN